MNQQRRMWIVGACVLLIPVAVWGIFRLTEGDDPERPPMVLNPQFIGGPGEWARSVGDVPVKPRITADLGADYRSVCLSAKVNLANARGAHELMRLETLRGNPVAVLTTDRGRMLVRDASGTELRAKGRLKRHQAYEIELCHATPTPGVEVYLDGRRVLDPEPLPAGSLGVGRVTLPANHGVSYTDAVVDDHPGLIDTRPALMDVTIEGAGSVMLPAFTPYGGRYAIYPSSDTKDVVITATPEAANDEVTVNGQVTSRDDRAVHLAGLEAGDQIVVEVSSKRGGSRAYELIYLPIGFPRIEATVEPSRAVSPGPIYLALPVDPAQPYPCQRVGSPCYVMTVDDYGVPIYYRQEANPMRDFKLQPGGFRSFMLLLPPEVRGGNENSEAIVLGPAYQEVGRYRAAGLKNTNGHDFLIRESGNHVFLSFEYGRGDFTGEGGSRSAKFFDGVVQEQHPDGNVAFRWNSSDHIPLSDSERGLPDPFHINSVIVTPEGDYIVSERGVNQVLKIGVETGEVLWHFGSDAEGGLRVIDDPLGGFCGQHTATLLPNGHILVFDNGQSVGGGPDVTDIGCPFYPDLPPREKITRVVEYELDLQRGTATLVWSYRSDTFAPAQGSAQRLPNGNTMIGWGVNTSDLLASEVNPEGKTVLTLSATLPDGTPALSYRVFRFPE